MKCQPSPWLPILGLEDLQGSQRLSRTPGGAAGAGCSGAGKGWDGVTRVPTDSESFQALAVLWGDGIP